MRDTLGHHIFSIQSNLPRCTVQYTYMAVCAALRKRKFECVQIETDTDTEVEPKGIRMK